GAVVFGVLEGAVVLGLGAVVFGVLEGAVVLGLGAVVFGVLEGAVVLGFGAVVFGMLAEAVGVFDAADLGSLCSAPFQPRPQSPCPARSRSTSFRQFWAVFFSALWS
ncbi:hypothetical protein, partial [Streptomyces flaveus]|uniref:hypothetical protein n=1 Tax=Streptomyces flaveus TaxID=66370 RepID=UPI003316C4E2